MKSSLKDSYGLSNVAKLELFMKEWDVLKATMAHEMMDEERSDFMKVSC